MREFLMFIIGALLMYLMLQKPLKIKITHVHKTVSTNNVSAEDMKDLEKQMLTEDPKSDSEYEQFNSLIAEVNNIMGGSDRNE